jgi:glycosyltransferase involved in cell wall biosynthesis
VATNRVKVTPTVSVCGAVSSGALQLVSNAVKGAGYSSREFSVLNEPSYRGASGGGVWARWWLRLRVHAAYPLRLFWEAIRGQRGDIFIVTTNPFFALFAAKAGCFFSRAKTLWLVHDLYPEALEAGGYLRPNGVRSRLFGWFTRRSLHSADATVFLGRVLAQHAGERWGIPHASAVIPPVSVYDWENSPISLPEGDGPLRILYSGHLGHLHAVETLAKCVRGAKAAFSDHVTFHFQVSGPFVGRLKELLDTGDSLIEPTKSTSEEHRKSLAENHLALVSISPLGSLAAFPSKTFSALASGRPVLAICPAWSDLGQMISEHHAGWVVSNSEDVETAVTGDVVAARFVETLRQILDGRRELALRAKNAREVFKTVGSKERLAEAWKEIVEKVVGC